MSEKAILIITHGLFGKEIVESAKLIMGEIQNVSALSLNHGDSVEDLRIQAKEAVENNLQNGLETIVLVDLLGGSPSNVAMGLLKDYDLKILTGLNLPMLIETIAFIHNEREELVHQVTQTSIESIKKIDRSILT